MSNKTPIFFKVKINKYHSKSYEVGQMSNDWIIPKDSNAPISLKSVTFDRDNRLKVLKLNDMGYLGQMFTLFYDLNYFKAQGKFKKSGEYERRHQGTLI